MIDTLDLEAIVMRLIGPVDPIGETNQDAVRLDNLKRLTRLVEALVVRIDHINYSKKAAHQASIKAAAAHCEKFLKDDLGINNCTCEQNQ